ncbi:anti-sigma factor [Herbiconiux sp. L3-i23]|uniref:anti-sigma factor n=1 Tax=Herbiconiux sp. L3-i23 TaxID=2905871 RepID=UPI0020693BA7|nr:anti-sigma factor [Herbiconiux sp. L3-i23]BDI23759.1 hypothetical protein L3i23_25350 [Herbiconiux sp. L3-i23]
MTTRFGSHAHENLSGAYALDALSELERLAFEEQLRGSEELRAEVAGFVDTAALLAAATAPVAPPVGLKSALLDRLDSTLQLPADDASPMLVGAVAEPVRTDSRGPETTSDATVTDLASRRRRRPRGRLMFAVTSAAAAVALFVGGIALGATTTAPNEAEQLASISAASDMRRIDVDLPAGGSASLLASADLELSAVVMHDVASLPDDEVYQAWFVREDGPVSAGLVAAASDGYRILDGDYDADAVVALTVEPAGGSAQPTTDPIVFAGSPAAAAGDAPSIAAPATPPDQADRTSPAGATDVGHGIGAPVPVSPTDSRSGESLGGAVADLADGVAALPDALRLPDVTEGVVSGVETLSDGTGEVVDDTLGAVDGTLDGVGRTVDGTLGAVDGLLGAD